MELMKEKLKAHISSSEGLTLLELILTLAVLGIVIVVILPFFASSAKNLVRSGARTENIVELQGEIGEDIKSHRSGGTDTVTVEIEGFGEKPLKGKLINIGKETGEELTTFVPNEIQ